MLDKIRTAGQYNQVMALIEQFLTKATKSGGFHTLTKVESQELKRLSELAEEYEDGVLKIMPLPEPTVAIIVQQKAEEKNLTQKALAAMFGMDTTKISQILNGKRQPDVSFLKAAHEKLGLDGNMLLELA